MAVVGLAAAAALAYALFALLGEKPDLGPSADAGVEAIGAGPDGERPSLPVAGVDADLTGRVVDTAGEPIAGVEITARPEAIDAGPRAVDAGAGLSLDAEVVTRTDGGGRFAVAGLGAGHVRLEIAGPAVIASEVRFVAIPQRDLEVVAAREVAIAGRVDGAVAGVTVTAVGESNRATATTGADGEFVIAGLSEGVYRVFAADGERGSPAVRVERRGAGPFEAIALAMAPAAIISGRLIDAETGTPLAGRVVLTHDGDEPPRQDEAAAGGRFAIEGVPPGRWYAEASAPGYVGDDSLAFSADRSRELTLRLSRGGSLAGVVLDPDGMPVSGALVEASGGEGQAAQPRSLARFATSAPNFVPRGELGVMTGPIPFPPAQPIEASRIAEPIDSGPAAPIDGSGSQRLTDDRGRFRIVGLKPGRYRLLASHPDFAGGASAPVAIALGTSREGIEVIMARGIKIRGVVRDRRGDPIVAARVTASSSAPMPLTAHTDARGRFVLPPLTGKTTLTASAAGYAAATREIAEPGDEEVAFQLERADRSIAGRVADPAGFPLRGARLTVRDQPAASAVTDDGGRFELGNLAGGNFEITIRHPDYPEHQVELETGRGHEIEVPLGGGIEGLVIDTDSRRPMAATVVIRGAGKTRTPAVTIQSSDGGFERAPLAPGRYTVRANAPGYAAASTTVEVSAGSRPRQVTARDVLLELERGASIAGTVRDENGERVAGAAVRAGDVEGTTDIDGGFSLRDVPAVRDLEIVAEKGDRRGVIELTLTPGDELTTVEISISP